MSLTVRSTLIGAAMAIAIYAGALAAKTFLDVQQPSPYWHQPPQHQQQLPPVPDFICGNSHLG